MRTFQLDITPRVIVKALDYANHIIIEQEFGISVNQIRLPKDENIIRELIKVLEMAVK